MSFEAIVQEHLRHAHDRAEALRRELSKQADPPHLAQVALQELFTAMEELQVTEEELRQQNESLAAAQLLLEEENQRYVELFHAAPDAYLVTTADGTIREANDAAGALLGIAPPKLEGKPLALFVAPERTREFRERVYAMAGSAGRVEDWELVLTPRGGGAVPVACTVGAVPARGGAATGLRWIVRDVTARLEAEETARRLAAERAARAAAEAGERRLRAVLESITDAFVTLDREWRFTYLNPRAAEYAAAMLGVPGPFEGRVVWELLPTGAEGSRAVAELRAAMEGGARAEFEVRGENAGRWFSFRVHPMAEGLTLYFTDVTERREAEEERLRLHREAERQRAFLDAVVRHMPTGVAIAEAPGGRIVLHNAASERILGLPLTAGEVADYAAHGLLRDDGTPLAAHEYPLARALRGETLTDEEIALARADGAPRTLQVSAAPVREEDGTAAAAVVTFQDATERRRRRVADQLLARASEILSSSLESAATLQAVADLAAGSMADYCIVHVEEGTTLRAAGLAHADPRRREILRGLIRRFPVDPEGPHPVVRSLRTGEPQLLPRVPAELLEAISTGPEHMEMLEALGLASALAVPMRARGRTLGVIAFGRGAESPPYDEHDLRVAEELARRAGVAVDNATLYESAQLASRTREEVLAVVSHDLRNPLNVVVLGAMLLDELSDTSLWTPRDRQQLRAIRNAAEQMSGLIQDLVEVVALESGSPALLTERLVAADVVAGAVEMMGELAAREGLRLSGSAPRDLPVLCVDRARALRVFSNLLGNAIKFTPSGGEVTVSAERDGNFVRFAVRDTGVGIAPEHLPRLFDRFWQVERGAKGGLGLGLAICKGIIDAHGGRIWAASTVGEGSTFYFTLPLESRE